MVGFDIINFLEKKKLGIPASEEEIFAFVNAVAKEELPKYQISAFLMAVAIKGLTDPETTWLTQAIARSGKVYDIPKTGNKILVDKHSSGGIGDKTSIVLLPILVAAGLNVAKLTGRGLGFTGGTSDKLESIGVRIDLDFESSLKVLKEQGIFVIAQTPDVAPVDKVLYALRDVTSTVSSVPLIASSILSKKMCFKVDYLFLDIKYGTGAYCPTFDYARDLSKIMISISRLANINLKIFITSMQQPLGRAVGNAIEVLEAQQFLSGEPCSPDLHEFIVTMASHILVETGLYKELDKAAARIEEIIKNQEALRVCERWFESQGGNIEAYKNRSYFNPKHKLEVRSKASGYFSVKDNKQIGFISNKLGSGRMRAEDSVDFHSGIYVHKKLNEMVKEGDLVYTLYSSKEIPDHLADEIMENTELSAEKVKVDQLVIPYVFE